LKAAVTRLLSGVHTSLHIIISVGISNLSSLSKINYTHTILLKHKYNSIQNKKHSRRPATAHGRGLIENTVLDQRRRLERRISLLSTSIVKQ